MAWTLPATVSTGNPIATGWGNDVVTDLTLLQTSVGLYGEANSLAGSAPIGWLPGNFYMQVGVVSGSQTGFNLAVTFPAAFPNGVGPIIITPTSIPASTTGAAWYYTISAASASGFTVTASVSGNVIGFSWAAWGF